jgi:hypothetical protein
MDSLANNRHGKKGLPLINTLAYLSSSSSAMEKSFIILTREGIVRNIFKAVTSEGFY